MVFVIAKSRVIGIVTALALAALPSIAQGVSTAGQGSDRVTVPTFRVLSPPVLTPNANPDVPLAATIDLTTSAPTRVGLVLFDGISFQPIAEPRAGFHRVHRVPVLGVRPDTTYTVAVSIRSQSGTRITWPNVLTWRTPALPPDFPKIDIDILDVHRSEPGYIMLSPSSVTVGNPAGPRTSHGMILDQGGNVVWYMDRAAPTQRLRSGNLLVGRLGVQEVTMLGDVVNTWYAAGLDNGAGAPPGANLIQTDTTHHEFVEMPVEGVQGAAFLFLSTELRTYPNYPLSELQPNQTVASADIIGDIITEIDRDGNILREKHLLDILDPYRIAYDNSLGFYNSRYGGPTRDWSHGNSLYFDATDDTYIVSFRHQDCVVKIRRSTAGSSPDDIVWILGNHSGWREPWASKLLTPAVGLQVASRAASGSLAVQPSLFEWSYHQHAAFPTPEGTLLLFDNGNYRASPGVMWLRFQTWYTRAVEYEIDPIKRTVSQIWAAGGRADTQVRRIGYSAFVGNAQRQPITGNVLINAGASIDHSTGVNFVRIFEFDKQDLDNPVLQITIEDPTRVKAWSNYRALRLKSVYPTLE